MNDTTQPIEQLSWRDPDGFVVNFHGRILRAVSPSKRERTQTLIREPWMAQLIARGAVPGVTEITQPPTALAGGNGWYWLEHEVLPFPCFPHEITALQLHDAGQLTLHVAIEAAKAGWTLKDASAWNVLFSRGRPVFIDLLSFDKPVYTGTWIAYAQFVRHFLLPLLAYKKLGMTPTDVFTQNREGLSPERTYRLVGSAWRLLSLTALEIVLLPKLFSNAGQSLVASESATPPRSIDPELGKHLMLRTLKRLQRRLDRLRPAKAESSVWVGYEEDRTHYTDADLTAKKEFVRSNIPANGAVLDLGCNAGEFSRIAAQAGGTIVAADFDHGALSRLYSRIRERGMLITPLHLDISRPTPALGWQNKEIGSFMERAAGKFDCVLALGLIHHLLVSERAPLFMIAELLASFKSKTIILEWIEPADPRFRQISGLNHTLYEGLSSSDLESCMEKYFTLMTKSLLPCTTRVMYLWSGKH